MLRSLPDVAGVTSYDSGTQAVWAGVDSYDLVVMPGTALAEVQGAAGEGRPPAVRLLLLVDCADAGGVPEWADSCVHALVDWSGLTPAILGNAVADVVAGRFFVSPSLVLRALRPSARRPPAGPPGALLTPREHQVLLLLAEGLSNKHLARRLEISEHGVKRLVSCVLAKLNCPNRTLAVVRAIEHGLLSDPTRYDRIGPPRLGPTSLESGRAL